MYYSMENTFDVNLKNKRRGICMKMMKKMAALVLAAFLAVPMAGSIVYAAEGSLQFTDPETQVGETVKVDMVIRSGGDAIGDADRTSYNTGISCT